jgi:predicted XRE-type DNA-binding protein
MKPKGGANMEDTERIREPYHKFKSWMRENYITQKELADLLHVDRAKINTRLNGTGADFTLDEIRMIKETYKINTDEFFL